MLAAQWTDSMSLLFLSLSYFFFHKLPTKVGIVTCQHKMLVANLCKKSKEIGFFHAGWSIRDFISSLKYARCCNGVSSVYGVVNTGNNAGVRGSFNFLFV